MKASVRQKRGMQKNEDLYDVVGYNSANSPSVRVFIKKSHTYSYAVVTLDSRMGTFTCLRNHIIKKIR